MTGSFRSLRQALVLLPAALSLPAYGACDADERVALQVLGSGGPIADDARASSGYLVWIDGASKLLIDAGGGVFLRFGEADARFRDLDFIGISHFHLNVPDDVPMFVFELPFLVYP